MDIQPLLDRFCDYSSFIRGFSPTTIDRYRKVLKLFGNHAKVTQIEEVNDDNTRNYFYWGRTEKKWGANSFMELQERIERYQSYLGQTQLHGKERIDIFQAVRAAKEFIGEDDGPVDRGFAFHDDPDDRLQQFDIRVKGNLTLFNFANSRHATAKQIADTQQALKLGKITYQQQLDQEVKAHRDGFLAHQISDVGWVFRQDAQKIKQFVASTSFAEIPALDISSQMWTKLLVGYNNRPIRDGDLTDIDIISTYLPYVDVLATDHFMAQLVIDLGLDQKYRTKVVSAKGSGLSDFTEFIKNYLDMTVPVNRPHVSIFVLSDKKIKEKSFDFFKRIGNQSMSDRGGWVEIFAFDDDKMPSYYFKEYDQTLPFYGLQDVDVLKLDRTLTQDEVLDTCREWCRSDKFILIDSFRDIPTDFVETLRKYVAVGKERILNYPIYTTAIRGS